MGKCANVQMIAKITNICPAIHPSFSSIAVRFFTPDPVSLFAHLHICSFAHFLPNLPP